MSAAPRRFVCLPFVALLSVACAASAPEAATPKKPAASAPQVAPSSAAASATPGRLARAEVDVILTEKGPPWLFQRVVPEEVFVDGKFAGWRILSMPKEWEGLEIKPGDVITRVNGLSLERPEDLWKAWTSVLVTSELKIGYQRGGKTLELVLPIDGQAAKELPARLRDDAPPPARQKDRKKKTVVIEPPVAPPMDADAEEDE